MYSYQSKSKMKLGFRPPLRDHYRMATIPSFETILLEIHKSLGIEAPKKKQELIRLERALEKYLEVIPELIEEIFNAFGMDVSAKADAIIKIEEFANFNSTLEQSTWTYGADLRQVVWHLAGYSYAPWMGRSIAFLSIATPFDKGMAGGSFWYLPEIRRLNGGCKLILPIAQVLEWLLDLFGQPMDVLAAQLGGGEDHTTGKTKNAEDKSASILRTLHYWKKGKVPRVNNIEEYFIEGTTLNFKGSLRLDTTASKSQQLQTVLNFMENKKLDAHKLQYQIPLHLNLILKIINNKGTVEDIEYFIMLMQDRYAAPTLRTIRQRLLVARATQDGYIRLGNLLSEKNFDQSSIDIKQNKVLQLFEIFKVSYNLTIDAYKKCDSEVAENAYFENSIPPWDRLGIFLSVLPSRYETGCTELANKFSRIFADLLPLYGLEDHIGHDEASTISIAERNVIRLNHQADEDTDVHTNIAQLKTFYLPWSRTLQSISSFKIAYRVALSRSLSLEVRRKAVERMRQLSNTPQDIISAIKIELGQLLDEEDRKNRPKDARNRVEQLLDEAKVNTAYDFWRASILHYEAKHHLSINDFDKARNLFEKTLEACLEIGFGRLRGIVARDALAVHIERQFNGYSLVNFERFYLNMLAYGGLKESKTDPTSFEDAAREVSDYFWNQLYFPYFGEKVEQRLAIEAIHQLIDMATPIIHEGDWNKLDIWFKINSKLKDKQLKYVQGDTVLMVWLKMLYSLDEKIPTIKAQLPIKQKDELIQLSNYLKNWRNAICLLMEKWPKQMTLTDFKLQTPLMLAANQGDLHLVKALLKSQTDVSHQDFKGRTALHAAVFSRSLDCVQEVLSHSPNLTQIISKDTQSVLHVAVCVGSPTIVIALIRNSPELKKRRNGNGLNAFEFAKKLLSEISQPSNFQEFKNYMKSEKRDIGTLNDFHEVVAILSE